MYMMCCIMYVCTNMLLDYEARLAASNKEQQRLLKGMEQRQKMSRAKDTEISRLLNENEIMQKKCKQVIN